MMEHRKKATSFHIIIQTVGALTLLAGIILLALTLSSPSNSPADIAVPPSTADHKNHLPTLRINEYVSSNQYSFRDSYWESPDWIELYNYGDQPVALSDIYLSDDIEDPEKFCLPDLDLQPGAYLLVLASGNIDAGDAIRAPFKLGANDQNLLLFYDTQIIHQLSMEPMNTDISAGFSPHGNWGYYTQPTPGMPNTTKQSSKIPDQADYSHYHPLLINEYLSNNDHHITTADGDHYDWIELYNPNDFAINLREYYLSDDENQPGKYVLPAVELGANSYQIIFASGLSTSNHNEIHLPFRMGVTDRKLSLCHQSGIIMDQWDIQVLPSDVSCGRDTAGNFAYYRLPTPGAENTTPASSTMDITPQRDHSSPLIINEWMSNNQFGILDTDGDASDWIELYNPSDEAVSLTGYALSDDANDLFKWQFPDHQSIPAQGYLLIFASGKDQQNINDLHTSFALCDTDTLYLTAPNAAVIDSTAMEFLPGNVSKGRTESGWGYFTLPTPGQANTSACMDTLNCDASILLGDVYISEVASCDYHFSRYLSKPLYEYIELHNRSNRAIDLSGYTLRDSSGASFTMMNQWIQPDEFLLIAVKGHIYSYPNAVQAENLSLNAAGERILLINSDHMTIDAFDTGYLLGDFSCGRIGDLESRVFFTTRTPGQPNSADVYSGYTVPPQFSQSGGPVDEAFQLILTAPSDATVYYTTTGNAPDNCSRIYREPILIDRDSIIRAVAIAPGRLPSPIVTQTYILDRTHDIPVVCLTSTPSGLFNPISGIYVDGPGHDIGEFPYFESNYFRNVERPVTFEYYLGNGQAALNFDAGIQIAGGFTRAVAQKSLVIRLRDEYGLSEVRYPFFDNGPTTFKHILLRNAGQDGWKTKMRDCVIQNCIADLGTVDMKRGRPVAVYINGQYWGLYNLRDKLNDEHLAIKYSVDEDEIDLLTEFSSPKKGSNTEWMALREHCLTTDLRIPENYDVLQQQVDVDAFIDYIIAQTFFGNVDTHNINFWRARDSMPKWRPLLFDMDLSVRNVDYSLVEMYLGSSSLGYHSHVIRGLMRDEAFHQQLLERYAYVLNNIYTEQYLADAVDQMTVEIEHEIHNHLQRWTRPSSYSYWEKSVDIFRSGLIQRRQDVVDELQAFFQLSDQEVINLFPWYTP